MKQPLPETLASGVSRPDFYVASMGRSGSTMLCNWLSSPPDQLVFIEPFFTRPNNPRLLRIQLEDFGLAASDKEWLVPADSGEGRFRQLMAPRLQGRRWAFKEVLSEEHVSAVEQFRPPRVVLTVRDVADVALSFFEKHRLQGNLDRFSDDWVAEYCIREAAGLVAFREWLRDRDIPCLVVRYEDFTASQVVQEGVARFVGWTPGGIVDRHMERFDRRFESDRHGGAIATRRRQSTERELDADLHDAASRIALSCSAYRRAFGYF